MKIAPWLLWGKVDHPDERVQKLAEGPNADAGCRLGFLVLQLFSDWLTHI